MIGWSLMVQSPFRAMLQQKQVKIKTQERNTFKKLSLKMWDETMSKKHSIQCKKNLTICKVFKKCLIKQNIAKDKEKI